MSRLSRPPQELVQTVVAPDWGALHTRVNEQVRTYDSHYLGGS